MFVYTDLNINTYDPTRTTILRNAFSNDMKRRFNELASVVSTAVVQQDVFGLNRVSVHQMQIPGQEAFAFPRNEQKIAQFMKWLQEQVDRGILTVRDIQQIGSGVEAVWTNKYIYDSYKRGLIRARQELISAGYDVPSIDETGGIEISLLSPVHLDRVGLLYIRTYTALKGITDSMDALISQVLAQGMADGDGPRVIARKLVAVINGQGLGDLGIKDSLGRTISAEVRAEMLARTEIIRAHHLAMIQEYRNWGVLGIRVMAEIVTAGDRRVCDRCNALAKGGPYTLDQAEGLIPNHTRCRCIALPLILK